MHNAPAVTYPVGRSHLAGAFLLGAWLAGAAAMGMWTAESAGPDWRHAAGWAMLAVVGFSALQQWRSSISGDLTWDGSAWRWQQQAGTVAVHLDLQRVLLLRWQGESGGCWLCLERNTAPAQWNALRRAVYSRAIPDALQGPEPAAKT